MTNGAPVWQRQAINYIVMIGALFGAWFAIEAKVNSHVEKAETRIEKRLDRIETQVDDLHELMIRSKQ